MKKRPISATFAFILSALMFFPLTGCSSGAGGGSSGEDYEESPVTSTPAGGTESTTPEGENTETKTTSPEAPENPETPENPESTEPVYYTVTFVTNGGSVPLPQKIKSGETARKPSGFSKYGYVFVGWYTDSALTKSFNFATPIEKDTKLYAKWNKLHTVTFVTNGGTAVASQTVENGKTATKPESPTNGSFEFLGWYADSGLSTSFNFAAPISKDTTVYAKWHELYLVKFVTNNDIVVEDLIVEKGSTIQKPSTLKRTHYKLDGWFSDAERTITFDFSTPIQKDTTLYAKWTLSTTFGGTYRVGVGSNIRDFFMCDHEVTQGEYEKYCTYYSKNTTPNDTYGKGENYPVYYVSWFDALAYCNKRSIAEGLKPCYTVSGTTDPDKWGNTNYQSVRDTVTCDFTARGYRLPTDKEWEVVAMCGQDYKYAGSNDIKKVGWYKYNSNGKTHEVEWKIPNGYGKYDMTGNVAEWCWDWWDDVVNVNASSHTSKVTRGGAWDSGEYPITLRGSVLPTERRNSIGFRVVRNYY